MSDGLIITGMIIFLLIGFCIGGVVGIDHGKKHPND